jgi:hypothetical protein
MKAAIVLSVIAAVSLSACATKSYPIAPPLGAAQQGAMTCDDLELELARAEMVRRQISETAGTDWRSVVGFVGDLGVGNAMARSDAEKAISARVASIRAAQAARPCPAA